MPDMTSSNAEAISSDPSPEARGYLTSEFARIDQIAWALVVLAPNAPPSGETRYRQILGTEKWLRSLGLILRAQNGMPTRPPRGTPVTGMDVREFEYLRVGDVRDAARDAGIAWPILAHDQDLADEPLVADSEKQVKVPETLPTAGRQRQQEDEVLRVLKGMQFDPKKLPKRIPGQSGVKKEVWGGIGMTSLFVSKGVFDKAWERLRKSRDIQEQ